MRLPTGEMCITATADSFTVIVGAIAIAAIQGAGRAESRAAATA